MAKRYSVIIFILIIFLACSLGYNLIYKKNASKLEILKSQIKEERDKNDILRMIVILNKKIQAYRKRSFSSAETTQLLSRVLELARQLGIKVDTLTFRPLGVTYKEEYVEFPVKIPLRCSYHQLGKFISLIESSQEFIWIKEVDINKTTAADPKKADILNVTLIISGLYFK